MSGKASRIAQKIISLFFFIIIIIIISRYRVRKSPGPVGVQANTKFLVRSTNNKEHSMLIVVVVVL
jgi:hypothetical protein